MSDLAGNARSAVAVTDKMALRSVGDTLNLALRHIHQNIIELPLKKRARTKVVVVKWPIIIGAVHTARYQTSIEDSVLFR